MRKIHTLILLTALLPLSACGHEKVITEKELPRAAQAFIKEHFAGQSILKIEKDGAEYEIDFVNGWDVDLDGKGEWTDVNCERDALPASFAATLPTAIAGYVEATYPGAYIVEVCRGRKFEVELNNGLELEFSLKGEFLRIDAD